MGSLSSHTILCCGTLSSMLESVGRWELKTRQKWGKKTDIFSDADAVVALVQSGKCIATWSGVSNDGLILFSWVVRCAPRLVPGPSSCCGSLCRCQHSTWPWHATLHVQCDGWGAWGQLAQWLGSWQIDSACVSHCAAIDYIPSGAEQGWYDNLKPPIKLTVVVGSSEFSSLYNYRLVFIVVDIWGGQGTEMFVVHHASMFVFWPVNGNTRNGMRFEYYQRQGEA